MGVNDCLGRCERRDFAESLKSATLVFSLHLVGSNYYGGYFELCPSLA